MIYTLNVLLTLHFPSPPQANTFTILAHTESTDEAQLTIQWQQKKKKTIRYLKTSTKGKILR
jgi:hypothetical protein